jgi:class 3 adenylate cyclase
MSNQKITTKKLKAIVFTDIVNFTSISAKDEQVALDLIQKQNEIIKPIVEKHNGEWLKEIGDGLLLSFGSSIEAVRCSIEIKKLNSRPSPISLSHSPLCFSTIGFIISFCF